MPATKMPPKGGSGVQTEKMVARQRARSGGRYATMNACEACGKRLGADYCSDSRVNALQGAGLVLCDCCASRGENMTPADAVAFYSRRHRISARVESERHPERTAQICEHVDAFLEDEQVDHAATCAAGCRGGCPSIERRAHELRAALAAKGYDVDMRAARTLLVAGWIAALETLGRPDLGAQLGERFKIPK